MSIYMYQAVGCGGGCAGVRGGDGAMFAVMTRCLPLFARAGLAGWFLPPF
jgi:hypothetical protein